MKINVLHTKLTPALTQLITDRMGGLQLSLHSPGITQIPKC